MTARDYKDARDLVVTADGRVRGLVAEEFELMQGFPPRWTDIPAGTDGKRKKALGNSKAVPVVRWIGQRIAEQLSKQAT